MPGLVLPARWTSRSNSKDSSGFSWPLTRPTGWSTSVSTRLKEIEGLPLYVYWPLCDVVLHEALLAWRTPG